MQTTGTRGRASRWIVPSDARLRAFTAIAICTWTITMALAVAIVMAHERGEAATLTTMQATLALHRAGDALTQESRLSSPTQDGDARTGAECTRLRQLRSALPVLTRHCSVTLLRGSEDAPDRWTAAAVERLALSGGEEGTWHGGGTANGYRRVAALPAEQCSGCHPSRTRTPALVVDVPGRSLSAMSLDAGGLSIGGLGLTWLCGLVLSLFVSGGFRRVAADFDRLRQDHLAFFDESPSAALLVQEDADGAFGPIVRANRRLSDDVGLDPENVVGLRVSDVVGGMEESTQPALLRALREQGQLVVDATLIGGGGTSRPVEAEISYFEYEARPTIHIYLRDLGDRRAAEHAMARLNRRLALISQATMLFGKHLDDAPILNELVASAMRIVDATGGRAGLLTESDVAFTAEADVDGHHDIDLHLPLTDGVIARVLETRAPYVTNDALRDPLVSAERRERDGSMSLLCVPVMDAGREVLAILEVHDQLEGPFLEQDAFALLGIATSAGVVLESARAVRQLVETGEQLLDHQARLQRLADEVSWAQERERRRIALELHDGLGQTLAMMRLRLGQASQARTAPSGPLTELRELLDSAIAQTRSLTFQISPPVLYELGLGPALEWLCERLSDEHGMAFSFEETGEPGHIGEDLRAQLYAATRELLLNAVKHSGAGKVRVRLVWSGARIAIEVHDDGRGLSPLGLTENANGFGLFATRERLRPFRGMLHVCGAPGEGTSLRISVPYGEIG